MLSVMYIAFLCGLLLLSAACDYQLVRGRAQITDTFQMFVFSMHFLGGSSMFQMEADFSLFFPPNMQGQLDLQLIEMQ